MPRRLMASLAIAFLALSLPAFAADKEKKEDDKAKGEAEKVVSAGQVTGVLRSLPDGSQKYLSISVPVSVPTGGGNALGQQQMMMQLMRTPPAQRRQALLQMLMQMRNGGGGVQVQQVPVELQAADEMKVRTLF